MSFNVMSHPGCMLLEIPAGVFENICTYLTGVYPEEGCGLLLGTKSRNRHCVKFAKPLKNVDPSPKTRFSMDPASIFDVFRYAEDEGLTVLGIFHSHPEGSPRPSRYDLKTPWRGYIHLIITTMPATHGGYAAWFFTRRGKIIRTNVTLT